MRFRTLTIGLAALLLAGASVSGAGTNKKPAVTVSGVAPVQVKGSFFKQRELVRVTLSIDDEQRTRQVRASIKGSFVVVFPEAEVADRCSSDVWARAVGARGSLARAKFPQLACPPRLARP